jgi:alkanesulfonate monooxygenase SsuD/methylene tetrahydromethanopterin reductase-like flavin-dependent oxidoreductase (luciferase family)
VDFVIFENNKPFVIDEFREGRFDYIELASDVAEARFFEFLFGKHVVEQLAEHFPTPRQREHVPIWMYLASQFTLRLHGQHAFHGYPLIINGTKEG